MGLFDNNQNKKRKGFFDSIREQNNAPMERYLREEERRHYYECEHDDPYDCDGDCF